MKIIFQSSGGFVYLPSFKSPTILDTERIAPRLGQELKSLVSASRFFEQPMSLITAGAGAADYRTYSITVQDGLRSHKIHLTEPILDSDLERLVSRLQAYIKDLKPVD